jgi:hypothetical protein
MIPAAPGDTMGNSSSEGLAKGRRIPPVGTLHDAAMDAVVGSMDVVHWRISLEIVLLKLMLVSVYPGD